MRARHRSLLTDLLDRSTQLGTPLLLVRSCRSPRRSGSTAPRGRPRPARNAAHGSGPDGDGRRREPLRSLGCVYDRVPSLSPAVALVALFTNWVNTNGENVLFRVVQDALSHEVTSRGITDKAAIHSFVREGTTAFYGNFFFWVNTCALVAQTLLASRLLRYGGFAAVLLMLPLISFGPTGDGARARDRGREL